MTDDMLQALENSDVAGVSDMVRERMRKNSDVWEIHLSLFPVAQRVLNPPFINPHLPKMYRICKEFVPYLQKDEIRALVLLEAVEYSRRPKLGKLPKQDLLSSPVSFSDVESAIREQDVEKTAVLMASFYAQQGGVELARRLLLLGSGYLDDSLGHSVSCTAFILLEMLERKDQDPWPALATLSHYFCKGQFHTTPTSGKPMPFPPDETLNHHLLRATSGRGILNLHHTITRYAVERVRQFFSKEEYGYMILAWIAFMEDKEAKQVTIHGPEIKPAPDYERFYETFSKREAKSVVASLKGMMSTEQGRRQLGRFLVRGVCDQYQGNYNPHYLTGLGSALWVVDQYWNQSPIAINALFQYIDFFFAGLKSER
jgi:hypothetical protein